MKPLRRTAAAERDLLEIAVHVALDAPARVDVVLGRIEARLMLLHRMPSLGRARPELGAGLRGLPAPPFVVFYRTERDAIVVVRVLHGARDVEAALAR